MKDYHECSFQGCGKFFKRKDRLEVHFRTHTGERPFKCQFEGCAISYARPQHLTRHVEKSHAVGNKDQSKVRCSHCKQELANSTCLKKHVLSFHSVPTCSSLYKCPEEGCNEGFHKKKQLVVHRVQQHSPHLGEARKCYSCPQEGCGKLFNFPNKLKHHMKIHQGYACDVKDCSQVLPNWSSLRKHKALDHAPNHSCTVCGAVFKQKCNWKQHIKIHTVSQKSHACPRENCGRLFLYKKNLTQHVREFHDGEAIWRNRPRKQSVKRKKQRVSRKVSLAARLCGINPADESESNQLTSIPASSISVTLAVSLSRCDAAPDSASKSLMDKQIYDDDGLSAPNCLRDKENYIEDDGLCASNNSSDKENCVEDDGLSATNNLSDKENCVEDDGLSATNNSSDKENCVEDDGLSATNNSSDKENCVEDDGLSSTNSLRDKENCVEDDGLSAANTFSDKENCIMPQNRCETENIPCSTISLLPVH